MNDWGYACVAKLLADRHRRSRAPGRSHVRGAVRPLTVRRSRFRLSVLTRHARFERRQHVLDDVVGMFEPDREAHQAVADAELGALLPASSR